jgi:hypothetical protein
MGSIDFTAAARRLGMLSAVGVVVLGAAYAVTLAVGLSSLRSPQQPIGDPFFPILEILIILSAPLMVAVMVSVHAWTPPETKAYSLAALVFMSLLAGVTCGVHFVILTVGRQIESAGLPGSRCCSRSHGLQSLMRSTSSRGTSSLGYRC